MTHIKANINTSKAAQFL